MLTSETQHVGAPDSCNAELACPFVARTQVSTQALQQHIELLAPLFTTAPASACDHARWCVPSPGTIVVIKSDV